jgi:type IV pilus assembly protein PilW
MPTSRLPRLQHGLTLVELMIALVLGLLVSAGVLGAYLSTARVFSQNERYAFMQESARYALRAAAEDLAMADFWGQVLSVDTISTGLSASTGSCDDGIDLFDPATALLFNNYHASPTTTQFTPCTAVTNNRMGGSDVLVVKRVSGSPTSRTFVDVNDDDGDGNTAETLTTGAADLESNTVYLRSNGTTGRLIDDASSGNPPAVGESDWRYLPRVYFVRDYYQTAGDGIPALCRMDITDDQLAPPQCLAEGVEDMHLQFGLDTDSDGVANRYTATPTAAEMEAVITARVYLLVRSVDADPLYTNSKSYLLGDVAIPAANDGFYRRVFQTTVALRNPINLGLINQ